MAADPIRVLIADDSPDDAELELRELKKAGIQCAIRRVDEEEPFVREMGSWEPHVVLADFLMPRFTGMRALQIMREQHPDIPVILVSGTVGEEAAIESLKHGAADYVLKGNLARLPAAVERALAEAEARVARQKAVEALRLSEANYRSLIEQASDGIFVTDRHRNILLANPRFCEMAGYSAQQLLGRNISDTYPEEERSGLPARWARMQELNPPVLERRMLRSDGTMFPVEVSVREFEDGRRQCIVRDITERKQQEERIARLSRVQAVLSGINSAILRIRNREDLFVEACRIAVQAGFVLAWIGLKDPTTMEVRPVAWDGTGEDYIRLIPLRLTVDESIPVRAMRNRRPVILNDVMSTSFLRLKTESLKRGFRSMVALPLAASGETVGVLTLYASEMGFFSDDEMKLLQELAGDISFSLDYMAKEEKLNYLAFHDSLTGLPNRTVFHDRLDQQVKEAERQNRPIGVMVIDIDRFRRINETLGRNAGDALLRQFAQRWQQTSRDPSRLARVGGDQFGFIIDQVTNEELIARRLENRLKECFGVPYSLEGRELRASATAGIALFPNDGTDAETLFRHAEAAGKKAKQSGQHFMFYAAEMSERVAEKLNLENRLRLAFEREDYVLHYQPKVNVETRCIEGIEALIRWNDPELGLVPPKEFIPLMEETGLILDVGRWALRRAVLDHQHWRSLGLAVPSVAVNISQLQLRQKDFVAELESAVKDGAFPPGLELEITETLIMEKITDNIGKLEAIKKMGIGIAIDDFGTGYSSLAYLAKLPVQTLKIDRSFIVAMTSNPDTMTLVQTMISLAHSLRLRVVAEGVDSDEQAKFLHLLRCDQMQGYLISRPVSRDEMTALLQAESPAT